MTKLCGIQMTDGTVCDRPVRAKDMCSIHLARSYRGTIPLDAPFARKPKPAEPCLHCDNLAFGYGLCQTHYFRMRRGAPLEGPVRSWGKTEAEKADDIIATAIPDGECLIAALRSPNGYSRMVQGDDGQLITGYRLVYRVKNGPLKAGYQVHHACGNRGCVNPEHLVLATQRENVGEMLARYSYEQRIQKLEADNAELRRRLGMPTEST